MIVREAESARYLPVGGLAFQANGKLVFVSIDESYVFAAAQYLIDQGFLKDVSTQAEVVAAATNNFGWGLGAKDYIAIAGS